jgi:hypothetical protein
MPVSSDRVDATSLPSTLQSYREEAAVQKFCAHSRSAPYAVSHYWAISGFVQSQNSGPAPKPRHPPCRYLQDQGIGMLRAEQTDPTCLSKAIRSSIAERHCNSRNARHEDLDCECTLIAREIKISLWHNDESLDWSVEINGHLHEHVTSEVMEGACRVCCDPCRNIIDESVSSSTAIAPRLPGAVRRKSDKRLILFRHLQSEQLPPQRVLPRSLHTSSLKCQCL